MVEDEDRRDVEAVLSGDTDRFAAVVARWERRLVGLAYRFVGDPVEAEDMAQEAFLRAFRKLPAWRGEGRFGTWLFGLALNLYRSRLRAWRRRPAMEPIGRRPELDTRESPGVLERERRAAVRREVARLPPRYREAVVLYYFEERDVATAAARLEIPVGTLKARLHRARLRLRARLEEVL